MDVFGTMFGIDPSVDPVVLGPACTVGPWLVEEGHEPQRHPSTGEAVGSGWVKMAKVAMSKRTQASGVRTQASGVKQVTIQANGVRLKPPNWHAFFLRHGAGFACGLCCQVQFQRVQVFLTVHLVMNLWTFQQVTTCDF